MEYYGIHYDSVIEHHGIPKMRWGVRRYQNKDGTLTEAGKKRYGRDAREKGYNTYDSGTGKYTKKTKKGTDTLDVDVSRYTTEDIQRTKNIASEGSNLSRNLSELSKTLTKNKKVSPLDLTSFTDQELRDALNRANLERQYNDVFNAPQVSKGQQYAEKAFSVGTAALATTASALSVALAIKQLTGK